MLVRQLGNFVASIRFEPLQAMASPDLGVGVDTAEENQFSRGPPADKHHTSPFGHDPDEQRWHLGIGKSETAVGSEWGESPVIIEQEDSRWSRFKPIQKRTVCDLTLKCLHAGSQFK